MFIHKIFHLHLPVTQARESVREMGVCNGSDHGIEVTCTRDEPGGHSRLEMRTDLGQRIAAEIEEIPGDDPNRILFRSVAGSLELAGMVELFPIRPNLTEAVLTVECEPASPLRKAIETMSATVDRFINRQLVRAELCTAPARY